MPDLVGSIVTARDAGKGAAAASGHPALRSVTGDSRAEFAAAQPGLAWQTPIGQILFLQSVEDERT